MNTLAYRPDIDGLRGIAVLAVVLYHLGLGPLHGGFVGVDIFFVISGYLITSIIQREVRQGEFTFSGFYERRVRRIFPALFAVLLFTLLAGVWLLLPSDLVRLGKATLATLFFASNVLFWRQSGYFDTSSEYNSLLHTWSLAVEEQFYIGLPVLLLLAHRYVRHALKPMLLGCVIVSFALCLWQQGSRPTATFFLSPFRAWELLAGALLAVGAVPAVTNRVLREIVSLSALVLLGGSLWWIRAGSAFPGWQAAMPVAAAAALIHAGSGGDSVVRRCLQWRPLVLVGLISYSLYLWHWPLLVYTRYRMGIEDLPSMLAWSLAVVAVLLAIASYRWVETPFRRSYSPTRRKARWPLLLGTLSAMSCLIVLAGVVQIDEGWRQRFPPRVAAYDDARNPEIPFLTCRGLAPPHDAESGCLGGDVRASRRILLWGDSYALAWAPAFDRLGRDHGFAVEIAWLSECPGILGVDVSDARGCRSFNDAVAGRLAGAGLSPVVLVGSWGPYLDPKSGLTLRSTNGAGDNREVFAAGLARTVERIRRDVGRLVIVGPTPGAPGNIPFKMAAATAFDLEMPSRKSLSAVLRYNEKFWEIADGLRGDASIVLVDPTLWFRQNQGVRYLDEQGDVLYRDGGHLSVAGAHFVARHFPVDILFEQGSGETNSGEHDRGAWDRD